VIIAIAMVAALLIFATINIAMKIRRNKVAIGIELIVGEQGQALEDFGREGQVRVGSEIWRARSEDEIKDGDDVEVLAVDGLLLQVGKLQM
jgi:membrane-bound serine protease (ClpP class)